MVVFCYVLAGSLSGLVLLYWVLEVHYFIRMALCVILARFFKKRVHILDPTSVTGQQPKGWFEPLEVLLSKNEERVVSFAFLIELKEYAYQRVISRTSEKNPLSTLQKTPSLHSPQGICLSTDVDTLLYHMNNARYLRELDFARVDFYERTKLYRTIRAKGGAVVQGACTIRYRRFVRPFSKYKITSKIVYWTDNSIFMEHRFITPKDDFVRAIALCRQRLINVNAEDVLRELMAGDKGVGIEAGYTKPECPLEVQRWNESNEISSANLRNGC